MNPLTVKAIGLLYEQGSLSRAQLSVAFGLPKERIDEAIDANIWIRTNDRDSQAQVSRIVRGERWGHLDDEPDEPETPLFDAWLREYELGLSGDELEEFREGVARLRSTDDGAGRG